MKIVVFLTVLIYQVLVYMVLVQQPEHRKQNRLFFQQNKRSSTLERRTDQHRRWIALSHFTWCQQSVYCRLDLHFTQDCCHCHVIPLCWAVHSTQNNTPQLSWKYLHLSYCQWKDKDHMLLNSSNAQVILIYIQARH